MCYLCYVKNSVNNNGGFKILPFPSRTKPFRIVVSIDGKRRSLYFDDRPKAEQRRKELLKYGIGILRNPETVKASAGSADNAAYWNHMLVQLGLRDQDVYPALERYAELAKLKPGTVREALNAFYLDRKKDVDAGRLAKKTLMSDRTRLVKLDEKFGRSKVTDLTKGSLLEWLTESPGDNARSLYKSLSVFVGWAVDENYLKESPIRGIKPARLGDYGVNNEFYPVATFRRMLRVCAGLDPVRPGGETTREFIDLLPYLVLSGFAGLRTKEAMRLDSTGTAVQWSDLRFDDAKPHLQIREEVAKKTRRKAGDKRPVDFPHAVEALKAWLALCPRQENNPFIIPWTMRKIQDLKGAFTKVTGIKFVDNGLRNSFGTYAFSYSGESALGQVAKQMGTSEVIAKRHYVQNLPAGTGKDWFDLRPFEVVQSIGKAVGQ